MTLKPSPIPEPVAASVGVTEAWEAEVLARLAALKRYPTKARQSGLEDTVLVRVTLDRRGTVLSARVERSRGVKSLDAEAKALVLRASPLPPPPQDVKGEIVELIAPIEFLLRRA